MAVFVSSVSDSGASKFVTQIQNFAQDTIVRLAGGSRAAIFQLLKELVDASPVSSPESGHSGRFKANWLVSEDAPANTYDPDARDPSGASVLAKGQAALNQLALDENYHVVISNHAPYAVRLEYGWSDQAPTGMVRLAAARWSEIVNEFFIQGGGGTKSTDVLSSYGGA